MTRSGSDPETELRKLWTAKGVPRKRQDELIAEITAKAQLFSALTIGARVHDRCDPRHTGHVESIMLAGSASKATVRWESTGWLSYVALGSLVIVASEERPATRRYDRLARELSVDGRKWR